MSLSALVAQKAASSTLKSERVADIIEFAESDWGLKQKLFPVQKIILKAAYGIPLDDEDPCIYVSDWRKVDGTWMTEAEYLEHCYKEGRCNISKVEEGVQLKHLVLPLGRRSGKTQLAAIVSAYESYKLLKLGHPQSYYGLPPRENIGITCVATDKTQASILFSKATGYFQDCPFFANYVANNNQTLYTFQTPWDVNTYGRWAKTSNEKAKASIRLGFHPCRAKALRGGGNILIILDEFAFFAQERAGLESQDSAEKIYAAAGPSQAAFSPKDPKDPQKPIGDVESRLIEISSPQGKQGLFYEHFRAAFSGSLSSKKTFALRAPSWEVNPSIEASFLEEEYARDPVNFHTEFGAEFSDRTLGWLSNPEDLEVCIDERASRKYHAPAKVSHFLGFDFGQVNDASALAICHIDNGDIVVDVVDEIRAGVGKFENTKILDFDDVADWVADYAKRFNIVDGLMDQNVGIPMMQALHKRGLRIQTEHITKVEASQHFRNFKDMMYARKLRLYNQPRKEGERYADYIKELLTLQAEYRSKYVVIVEAPKTKGATDDRSDALVRAIWMASQRLAKPKTISSPGMGPASVSGVSSRDMVNSRLKAFRKGTGERQISRRRVR